MKIRIGELRAIDRKLQTMHYHDKQTLNFLLQEKKQKKEEIQHLRDRIDTLEKALFRCDKLWMSIAEAFIEEENIEFI